MKTIALIFTLGLCLEGAERIDAAKSGMDPARLALIPKRMKSFVDKGTMAGSVTLVARHGQVVSLEAVGYTDIETKQAIHTDAIFQIHSMTKPIVTVGAMMLVE